MLNASGNLELHGTIVKAHRELSYGRYRLGIQLSGSNANNQVINKFINSRQTEIINEIRAEYNNLVSNLQRPQ